MPLKTKTIIIIVVAAIILIIIPIIISSLIYLIKPKKSKQNNNTVIEKPEENILPVNNSKSEGIKNLTLTYSIDSKNKISGFISDYTIIDEINRALRSKSIKLMIFSRFETPKIEYEYTITYPDKSVKYLTSDIQIKDILIISLPEYTTILETRLSGGNPSIEYKAAYNENIVNNIHNL